MQPNLKVKYLVAIGLVLLLGADLVAGDKDKSGPYAAYQLGIVPTTEKITLDGILDEKIWSIADKADDFTLNFPNDTMPASAQTEVMITYDKQNLYEPALL